MRRRDLLMFVVNCLACSAAIAAFEIAVADVLKNKKCLYTLGNATCVNVGDRLCQMVYDEFGKGACGDYSCRFCLSVEAVPNFVCANVDEECCPLVERAVPCPVTADMYEGDCLELFNRCDCVNPQLTSQNCGLSLLECDPD